MCAHHLSNQLAQKLVQQTSLPVVGAPLFLISNPKLVIAQCCAGIIGSFPALNAREEEGDPVMLEAWLAEITEGLDRHNQAHPDRPAAPFAVNLIVHKSNVRLERDVEILAKWKVPIWITSLGAREFVNDAAHQAGAIVLHDVIHNRFAKKAIENALYHLNKGLFLDKNNTEILKLRERCLLHRELLGDCAFS